MSTSDNNSVGAGLEKMPRLSVVMPVWNVVAYLVEAMESVLQQEPPPYEIVVIDDGSIDGGGALLDERYGGKSNIVILHTENRGPGEARNLGARVATGDYIYFFDSDDIALPGLVAAFNEQIAIQPELDLFCFSATSFFDPLTFNGDTEGEPLPSYQRLINRTFSSGEDAFNELSFIGHHFLVAPWGYIFRKEVTQKSAIEFLPILHEDEEFTPRLFLACGITQVVPDSYFHRRIRRGSIMYSMKSARHISGYLAAIESTERLLSRANSFKASTLMTLKKRHRDLFATVLLTLRKNGVFLLSKDQKKIAALLKSYLFKDFQITAMNYFPKLFWKLQQSRNK